MAKLSHQLAELAEERKRGEKELQLIQTCLKENSELVDELNNSLVVGMTKSSRRQESFRVPQLPGVEAAAPFSSISSCSSVSEAASSTKLSCRRDATFVILATGVGRSLVGVAVLERLPPFIFFIFFSGLGFRR